MRVRSSRNKKRGDPMHLSIADDLVEHNLPSLVLWHSAELRQLLPSSGTNEQFWLSSRCDVHNRICVCWVRSDELVILLWVNQGSMAGGRRGGCHGVTARGMRFARGRQVHVCWHPDETLLRVRLRMGLVGAGG